MSGYLASFLASLSEGEPEPQPKQSKPVAGPASVTATPEAVTPETLSGSQGVTEKQQQNQYCNTRNTCNTTKIHNHEQKQSEAPALIPSDQGSAKIDPTEDEQPEGSSEIALIAKWRSAVAAVESELPDIVKLRDASLHFLDSSDALAALANDWDAVSLFGMHEGEAPRARIDCWGLVLFLAWGVHRATVETIDQKVCALRTRSGAVQSQPRNRANFDQAVPWWRHPGVGSDASNSSETSQPMEADSESEKGHSRERH